ncbi:MAG: PBP1A family penicillin-binding protein [Rickettsiales bacterium]|nr:PBP1A family penicillin-binding protein [Rickettsiales bacterium]
MKFFKFILKWGFFFSIWIAIFATLALFYYFKDLPSLSDLEAQNGKQIVQINYANEARITNRGEIYSSEVSYYELPQHLINAVVATEDRRFFNHHGVDLFGILRASYVNHSAGRIVQGGSTITQQLAKLLFLDPERTVKRKIQEILLAVQLERNFTKEQILTFYLNRAYFGSGSYGVGNAAKHYFGKDVSRLSLNEAALLAGVLKAPSKLSPKNNRELAEDRASIVIKNMIDAGFLDQKSLKQLDQDPSYKIDHSQKLYFADFVFDSVGDFLPESASSENLLKITSTLDEEIQEKLENISDKFVEKNSKKLGKSQIAVVVMNKGGAVLAMSGGTDYQQSQFNRAVTAKRQAGSAFKTFVYLAAFESGMNVDDVLEDKKTNVGTWLPENYENRYLGEVTLRQAFANSLNSIAVQLGRKAGGGAVAEMASACGIVSKIDKNDPTIALGTTEVSLLELTGAYATIANDGAPVIPYAILEVKNAADESLYKRESSGFDAVISAESQQKIKEVLRAVVEEGTGKNANVAKNIYGKTGTSQNFRDAWFVGFSDDYVIGVWIGNDDNSATNKITGGSLPAILFAEVIENI